MTAPSGQRVRDVAQFIAALIAGVGLIFIKHINNPFGDGFLLARWLALVVGMAPDRLLVYGHDEHDQLAGWAEWAGGGGDSHFVPGAGNPHALLCRVAAIECGNLAVGVVGRSLGLLAPQFCVKRIFMGSSGSYFLGFAIAALGIIGARLATVVFVLGMPILDVAWLIWNRWRRGVARAGGT